MNERAKSGPLPGPSTAEVHVEAPHSDLVSTFFKMWKFSTSVFLIFFVTLSCYPAVNSAILSTASNKAWKGKISVCLYVRACVLLSPRENYPTGMVCGSCLTNIRFQKPTSCPSPASCSSTSLTCAGEQQPDGFSGSVLSFLWS